MNHEGHDEREGIRNLGMRLPSPLSDEAERAMTDTIGCAIAVHKALGPGYLESIYQKAMRVEFEAHGIGYEFRWDRLPKTSMTDPFVSVAETVGKSSR